MAKKWTNGDSARTMTNKYNQAVDDITKLESDTLGMNVELSNKISSEEADFSSGVPSPVSSILRLSVVVPNNPYDNLVLNDASLFGNYAIVGGSCQISTSETKFLPADGIDISILADGIHITCSEYLTYQGKTIYLMLIAITDMREEDE